jgi:hypothetical protein
MQHAYCALLHASQHARVRACAFVSVCVCMCEFVSLRVCAFCVDARACVRVLRACVLMRVHLCVCAFACSWDAQLVLAGYQGYSEGTREHSMGTQDPVEGYSRRTHAHGVYAEVLRGNSQKVRACV